MKFNEEQDNFVKHNRITIQKLSELKLQVHLGFLKLNHTYEIVVPLEIPNHIDNINWITNVANDLYGFYLMHVLKIAFAPLPNIIGFLLGCL